MFGPEVNLNTTVDNSALIESYARKICSLGLTTPAIFLLEMHKPLTSVFHTAITLAEPVSAPIFGAERIHGLREFLSIRENVELLITRLEWLMENELAGRS